MSFRWSDYHDLLGGQRRGCAPALLRALLACGECFYGLGARWRNARYDRNAHLIRHVDAKIVSVGNITTGGTGKTPMVAWLARWFRTRSVRVALISRGYGAREGSRNDEALELEEQLDDVPHLQNPDRVAAAKTALEELESQLLLLDDAFQHRRLHRDLDIVLIDALNPFGFDHLLPRGLLREPLAGLRRADVIVLSRADLVDAERRAEIKAAAHRHAPDAIWTECAHRPQRLRRSVGDPAPLDELRDAPIAAFCGIGNPPAFRATLAAEGFDLRDFREYPDHHAYERDDVESLERWLDENPEIEAVLCTHKDLVKLRVPRIGSTPLWALEIGIEFLAGREELETALAALLPAGPPAN